MKILTETMLRAATLADSTTEYRVEPDVFVTPLAKEYLRDRGISLGTSSAGYNTRTACCRHAGALRRVPC